MRDGQATLTSVHFVAHMWYTTYAQPWLMKSMHARGRAGWFGAAACTVTLEQLIMLQLDIIIVCFSLTQHMNNGWKLHLYSSELDPTPAYSLLVREGDAPFSYAEEMD